ncbi:NADP-dependent oxidoreductase domain-containing protein [Bisporella sp. PMI_857]|nr:NADP-dependent oxidoreductase domain-containing protein [Bisporella sp. PMI_857]
MSPGKIPPLGLGTFRLKDEAVKQAVRDAVKTGYRHIDTATIYKNEAAIGLALQEIYNDSSFKITRADLWLTSKLSPYDMRSPRASLLKSLSALQTPYLDLYLIHWPALSRKVASSPIHKQLRIQAWNVLNEAKAEGLVRNIGVSNFTQQHISELVEETEYGIDGACVQMEVHPWYWRDAMEIGKRFERQKLELVGYALLGEGRLLGESCPSVIREMAERLSITKVQLVLAWALKKGFDVLVRSVNSEHLRSNLQVLELVDVLTPEDCAALDLISHPESEEKLCWDPRVVK